MLGRSVRWADPRIKRGGGKEKEEERKKGDPILHSAQLSSLHFFPSHFQARSLLPPSFLPWSAVARGPWLTERARRKEGRRFPTFPRRTNNLLARQAQTTRKLRFRIFLNLPNWAAKLTANFCPNQQVWITRVSSRCLAMPPPLLSFFPVPLPSTGRSRRQKNPPPSPVAPPLPLPPAPVFSLQQSVCVLCARQFRRQC